MYSNWSDRVKGLNIGGTYVSMVGGGLLFLGVAFICIHPKC
jgi:hypothetical protein